MKRTLAWLLLTIAGVGVARPNLAALLVAPSPSDIGRALKIARESQDTRARFHAQYVVQVNDETVERVEVITEFRRSVLFTEEQLTLGNWMFAQGGSDLSGRNINTVLQSWKGLVSIRARLRFHPQNTFNDLAPFENIVGDPAIPPVRVSRDPIFAFDAQNSRDSRPPLIGAVVETVLSAAAIGQTRQPVRVFVDGRELTRLTIDFSRFE